MTITPPVRHVFPASVIMKKLQIKLHDSPIPMACNHATITKHGVHVFTHMTCMTYACTLKAYSLMLNRGRSQNFLNLIFLHIFVALL